MIPSVYLGETNSKNSGDPFNRFVVAFLLFGALVLDLEMRYILYKTRHSKS